VSADLAARRPPRVSFDLSGSDQDRRGPRPALAMTPMIDVVFLLIVFFMCSQFRTLEGELLAKLPVRGGVVPGARVKPDRQPPRAAIYVAQQADGPVVYRLNGVPLAGRDRLLPALVALRGEHPDLEAVLDGPDGLRFEHFLFAVDACLRAGIANVNLVRPKVPTPED